MNNKNIFYNHTLVEYNKKYRVRRQHLLKYTKKEVEEFDKKTNTEIKNFLLLNRKWWFIDGTYYEIPRAPRYTWFRNLNGGIQAATCLLALGAIGTATALPLVLKNGSSTPHIEPIQQLCTVTFTSDDEGATYPDPITVKGGSKIEDVPTSLNKVPGKAFLGWYDGDKKWDFNKDVVTKDITLTAKWSDDEKYKADVKFYKNETTKEEGKIYEEKKVPLGDTTSCPIEDPTDEEVAFIGWTKEGSEELFDFETQPIEKETIFVGKWETKEETCVITFKDQDGSLLTSQQVKKGNKARKPNDPEHDETLQFLGWTKSESDDDDIELFDFNTVITESELTLTAVYEQTAEAFEITGNHNFDIHTKGGETYKLKKIKNKGKKNGNIEWSISPEDDLEITGNGNTAKVTIKEGSEIKKSGFYTITATDQTSGVTDNFIIEIGSFIKLNEEKLKEGLAKKKGDDISGTVIIPGKYYNSDTEEWVTVVAFDEEAFKDCKEVDEIAVPTTIGEMGNDALKDTKEDKKVTFEDEDNCWKDKEGKEHKPTDFDFNETVIEPLNDGGSSGKAPTEGDVEGEVTAQERLVYTYDESLQGYEVKANPLYTGEFGKISIPLTYNDKPVIGFRYENTVGAFEGKNLTSITIPEGSQIESISQNCFKNCDSLTEVNFPNSFDQKIETNGMIIFNNAFDSCTQLSTIDLPKHTSYLEDEAFARSGLTSIDIPSKVTSIKNSCFEDCRGLTRINFTDDSKLNYIGNAVFKNCIALKKIDIPANVELVGYNAGIGAGFESITFKDYSSVWQSFDNEFALCETYSVDNNLHSKQFADLIKAEANYCYRKKLATKDEPEDPVEINGYFDFTPIKDKKGNIVSYQVSNYHVPNGKKALTSVNIPSYYTTKSGSGKSDKNVAYPVTKVAADTFNKASVVQEIFVPNTICEIGDNAFWHMSDLKRVSLPENKEFKIISENLCKNCSQLETINIPTSVISIGKHAFGNCTHLKSVDFGENSTTWEVGSGKKAIPFQTSPTDLLQNAKYLGSKDYSYWKDIITRTK